MFLTLLDAAIRPVLVDCLFVKYDDLDNFLSVLDHQNIININIIQLEIYMGTRDKK